jgi:hypothetical protein
MRVVQRFFARCLRTVPGVSDPVQFAGGGGNAFLQVRLRVRGSLGVVGSVGLPGSRGGAGLCLVHQLLVGRGG